VTASAGLAKACLEIVHVAVLPGMQRRGVGKQGWQVITTEFRTRPGQVAFWLMGLEGLAG
jgi:hypothetical protein